MGYVSPHAQDTILPDLDTSQAPHPAVDPLPDPDGALYSSGESSGSQTGTLTDYGDFEYGMDDAGMGLDTAIGMDEAGMGMYGSFGMGA